jgi:hypothetical protein
MKREIVVNIDHGREMGVIVIEAKIGSKLSERITNADKYNQAARSIACLAELIIKAQQKETLPPNYVDKCFFIVFGPKGKVGAWKGANDDNIKQLFDIGEDNANRILKQIENRGTRNDNDKFLTVVSQIFRKSTFLSWEDVLNSMLCQHHDNNLKQLAKFYKTVLDEADPKCNLNQDFFQRFNI